MTAMATGCTVCGTENTTTVDGVCGRRCAAHPPTFDPEHAIKTAMTLGIDAAMPYIRTDLTGEPTPATVGETPRSA